MSIFDPFASTGSGSCINSTKLCVPGGTCDQSSFGEGAVGPDACVYLSGITPPSSHALVVMINGGLAGPRPPPRCPAGGVCGGCAYVLARPALTREKVTSTIFGERVGICAPRPTILPAAVDKRDTATC